MLFRGDGGTSRYNEKYNLTHRRPLSEASSPEHGDYARHVSCVNDGVGKLGFRVGKPLGGQGRKRILCGPNQPAASLHLFKVGHEFESPTIK